MNDLGLTRSFDELILNQLSTETAQVHRPLAGDVVPRKRSYSR